MAQCVGEQLGHDDRDIVAALVATHRRKVTVVKSLLARTDRLSVPAVRVAILGKQVQRAGAGYADSGQFPLAMAAISIAGASQWQRVPRLSIVLPAGASADMAVPDQFLSRRQKKWTAPSCRTCTTAATRFRAKTFAGRIYFICPPPFVRRIM